MPHETPPESPVSKIVRPADNRPAHDKTRLAARGIQCYESRRLRLYTDLDPELARQLPPTLDRVYPAWEAYFGPLPPNQARTDFQVTGYLMVDRSRFADAGLIPRDLPPFLHGRHRGAEFWMNEQPEAYYRRHLLIHEATHCFMTVLPNTVMPVWYFEGMAELFGTHRVHPDGSVECGVFPDGSTGFEGWGRIRMLHDELAANKYLGLEPLRHLRPEDTLRSEAYAWCWALARFLDSHPRYRERFRELGQAREGGAFAAAFERLFGSELALIDEEWQLFIHDLRYGYDIERSAINFEPGKPLAANAAVSGKVQADRGWQSTRVLVKRGQRYTVSATGRFTLAKHPQPWVSEPQGISFEYFEGQPIGRLLGAIRDDEAVAAGRPSTLVKSFPLGAEGTFTAAVTGTLYVRLNDVWSQLSDNEGAVQFELRDVTQVAQPGR